jgi:hypothetical protein
MLVFGSLALLLAWRAPAARRRRAMVLYALLGLTLGLGFWTNFLSWCTSRRSRCSSCAGANELTIFDAQ